MTPVQAASIPLFLQRKGEKNWVLKISLKVDLESSKVALED
jgi:hypothetical protein